jgi:hypothetical protein
MSSKPTNTPPPVTPTRGQQVGNEIATGQGMYTPGVQGSADAAQGPAGGGRSIASERLDARMAHSQREAARQVQAQQAHAAAANRQEHSPSPRPGRRGR